MDDNLKPFAEAVGEMCNEWAHLEQWVTRLFLSIGGWDYRLITTLTMSNCLNRRDQIKAAKIGAMIRCPPGDFLDAVIGSLDYIDNYLRNTRNRFVHDIWSSTDEDLVAVKVDFTPRSTISPLTGVKTIQHWQNLRIDIGEVREVTSDIRNEREYVAKIFQCFQNADDDELPKQSRKTATTASPSPPTGKAKSKGQSFAKAKTPSETISGVISISSAGLSRPIGITSCIAFVI